MKPGEIKPGRKVLVPASGARRLGTLIKETDGQYLVRFLDGSSGFYPGDEIKAFRPAGFQIRGDERRLP